MGQWHELRHRCILALEGSGVGRDNLHIQCLYVQPRGSSAIGVNVMFNKEEQRDLAHRLGRAGLDGELDPISEIPQLHARVLGSNCVLRRPLQFD